MNTTKSVRPENHKWHEHHNLYVNPLPIFTLSNLSLPSLLIRVSDPSFVQLRDDVFLNMIKLVEPLKSAASLITR